MATKKLNLVIRQGETFQRVIRWEMPPYIYKPITAITRTGPVKVTAVGHGLATGWRAAVVTAGGMEEINAKHLPPRDNELIQVTVVDVDNVTLNPVNSSDYTPYTSGGYLKFFTPVDLTGYVAKMEIKDRVGGTVLLTISTGLDGRIQLDASAHTISINIIAADTAAITWSRGVYDLEMTSPSGSKTTIFSGNVSVIKEVTTS